MKNNNKQKKSLFVDMEEQVSDFWEKGKIFEKSLEKEALNGDYVFFDGPPFATGTPHYGHIVGTVMKDVVPRFWTMNGYKVERKWGWDCHGLPIENIVEIEMGSKSKKDIEERGVAEFNELCRSKVLSYVDEWEKIVRKIGRWADMDNAYKTMDVEYMESVWWVFKELWDKDLIYKDHRSMHVCPRCETTLSQSEVSEGYKDIKDLSCISKFELLDSVILSGANAESKDPVMNASSDDQRDPSAIAQDDKVNCEAREDALGCKVFVLAWTTTPWTLIGNVALAVGEDIDYVLIKKLKNEIVENYIIAESIYNDWREETAKDWVILNSERTLISDTLNIKMDLVYNSQVVRKFKGSDLIGKKYKPLFDYYSSNEKLENRKNGWKIYGADFVTTEEGTGVVHIAPAFGEDDMRLGKENNLPFVQHLSLDGYFKPEVKDFEGLNVKPKSEKKDGHMTTDIEIIKYLAHNGLLFHKEKYEHSYPHCWRCDTPLINYATSSWFVNVLKIKDKALETAKNVNWSPAHIKEGRFGKWMEGARDWSISRQRFWASVMPIWECSCGERKVFGSVKDLEEASGEKITDLHKHMVDKITVDCDKCGETMHRIPDVLDTWFDSGSMPYAQMHYPFENKDKFEENFPAEFIAEGTDQTRAWFYYMHVLANGLKETNAYKNVIVNGIVVAEDGKKMSKKLQNYPDPTAVMEQYGADALRYYLLTSPVMLAENLAFSEIGVKEALRKIVMISWNVVRFYNLFATDLSLRERAKVTTWQPHEKTGEFNQKDCHVTPTPCNDKHILDKWIVLRLNELINETRTGMEKYDLPHATRPIVKFIDDLSTWYVRRSRDRFKGNDKDDKKLALETTRYVLIELSKVMAPFTPFIAEQIWQKVTGENFEDVDKSVHLELFPEMKDIDGDSKIVNEMNEIRKIVEMGLAKRDKESMKIRQPLQELIIKNYELQDEYKSLILDELNVKNVISEKGEGDISVELDTNITEELKLEGLKREMVRSINAMRKNLGLTIKDRVEVGIGSDNGDIKKTIEIYSEDMKSDVLANSINLSVEDFEDTKEVNVNGIKIIIGVKK